MKFRLVALILIALLSEAIGLVIFGDVNIVRIFSYIISIFFILFLKYRISNQNVYLVFQTVVVLLIAIFYFPNIFFFTQPGEVVVVVIISVVGLLLNLFIRTRSLMIEIMIISIVGFIGIITDNKTLLAGILVFPIFLLIKRFIFKNLMNVPIHFSLIFPVLVICLVFVVAYQFPNIRLFGARDFMWANALFGEDFANKYFYNSFFAYSNLKIEHLTQNNVHSLFVGLFSRFLLITAILNLLIFAEIFSLAFKKLLFNNRKVQFSLLIMIFLALFSGRSFLSMDDLSIAWWIGIFGFTKDANDK